MPSTTPVPMPAALPLAGGVAQAVVNAIKKMDPDREVKVMSAQGLADCKKMMMMAKAGKYNGYLLEGMACPGGCIAGAGTLADPAKSAMMLNKYKQRGRHEGGYRDSVSGFSGPAEVLRCNNKIPAHD